LSKLILYTGGARSGKSRLAQARLSGLRPVVYIATAEIFDAEMRERVARHQQSRPAEWQTIEEPLDLEAAVARALALKPQGILVDCLTIWLANHLLQQWERGWSAAAEEAVAARLLRAVKIIREDKSDVQAVFVTNEVGCSVVPDNAMARAFRDLAGRAAQAVAAECDEVLFVAAGLALKMK
jgi:adenosylcobinamide kinase / adenosylcobinamide-phosphate guanylyltransferase